MGECPFRDMQHVPNFTLYLLLLCVDHNSELLRAAVSRITEDEGFKLPTTQASASLATATKLLQWMNDHCNKEALEVFARKLIACLQTCFPGCSSTSLKTQREKMWKSFHLLHVSDSFVSLWYNFLDSTSLEKNPLFFQYVTDQVFQELITQRFTTSQTAAASPVPPLTYEEINALRYVAGYVCQKVKKNIEASKHPNKGILLLCLMDLCDEDEDASESADWIHAVNRGGLCLVSEATAMLFHEVELLVRKVFNKEGKLKDITNLRDRVMESVLQDESVQFHWCMLTTDIEEDKAKVLLTMIVDLFITVRGFSFAKSFMEMYKQATKKSTQKSKALRKTLPTKATDSTDNSS